MEDQPDEDICQGSLKNYDDDAAEGQAGWLGCDTCCAGGITHVLAMTK